MQLTPLEQQVNLLMSDACELRQAHNKRRHSLQKSDKKRAVAAAFAPIISQLDNNPDTQQRMMKHLGSKKDTRIIDLIQTDLYHFLHARADAGEIVNTIHANVMNLLEPNASHAFGTPA